MENKEVCEHCVPYGWNEDRVWYLKLGRVFGITPLGIFWVLYFGVAVALWANMTTNPPHWVLRLIFTFFLSFLGAASLSVLMQVPTLIYRFLRRKYQAAFKLNSVEHIHDMDRHNGDFLMQNQLTERDLYVRLGFGRRAESAIMRNGLVYEDGVSLKRCFGLDPMLHWQSVNTCFPKWGVTFRLSLSELLALIEVGITRPTQLLARAVQYHGMSDENRELKRRVADLEGNGFCGQVTKYVRAVIFDLRADKRVHQSRVGQRARVLLEATSERLGLPESSGDDRLAVIELEEWVKHRSSTEASMTV